MATKERADIVFCIDASDSMEPCLDAVKNNITRLIESFPEDSQRHWDLRFDLLAHSAGNNVFRMKSLRHNVDIVDALYTGNPQPSCFTSDVAEFKSRLAQIKTGGDEATLIALDVALDFPWRPAQEGHRVVVLLTDEPIETGELVDFQVSKITELVQKIHRKRIKLFIVAPESEAFYKISMADRCEYQVVEGSNDGMSGVNFATLLEAIGKSVSISQIGGAATDTTTPLFRQDEWTSTNRDIGKDKNSGGR